MHIYINLLITSFRIEITIYYYWVSRDADQTALLDPTINASPTGETLATALTDLTLGNRTIEVYNGEVFDYEDSFGLFIEGKVYDEDIAKFESVLTEWWQQDSGDTGGSPILIIGIISRLCIKRDNWCVGLTK